MKRFQDIVRELLKDKSNKSPYKRGANLNIESLENRSLLAAHPLADAPDGDFEEPPGSDLGFSGFGI